MVISDQPVADFSHLTAPEQLAAISRIEDVALVIAPKSLAAAYTAIPVWDVAATIYVPDGRTSGWTPAHWWRAGAAWAPRTTC